jgi:ADP-heptose:LPS heptosyltransferase
MSRTLVAGPWLGEMGWELCCWIPRVRYLSHRYKRTIVIIPKGHDYLYHDFADKIIHYDKKGKKDRWKCKGKNPKIPKKIKAKYAGAKFYTPTEKHCLSTKKEWFKYGKLWSSLNCNYDILIHARSVKQNDWIDRKCGGDRNYPVKKWREVLLSLMAFTHERGMVLAAASIGSKKGAHHIPGTTDLRGIPLDQLCTVMANSKVCIGTSSGPMHLAHLCGCPIVVFSDARKQKYIKGSNKVRYRKRWRAFDTPVKVLEHPKWRPSVDKVVRTIRKFL